MTKPNDIPGSDFLLRDGDLSVRPLCDRAPDYVTLNRWLQDPRVLEYFGGRDKRYCLEVVRERYAPTMLDQDGMVNCLIEFLNRPVGFIQIDQLQAVDLSNYGYPPEEIVFKVDLFIGETDLWGYGLGRRALKTVYRHLFDRYGARRVIVIPQVDNERAIRSYTAAGFRKVKLLSKHELREGQPIDCYLMEAAPEPSSNAPQPAAN